MSLSASSSSPGIHKKDEPLGAASSVTPLSLFFASFLSCLSLVSLCFSVSKVESPPSVDLMYVLNVLLSAGGDHCRASRVR